jgi:hypothetical protein
MFEVHLPQRTVCGYIFWCHNVQPLWGYQTPFILDFSRCPPSFIELYIHWNIQMEMFRWVYDLTNNGELSCVLNE